jgi:hypothetical protein
MQGLRYAMMTGIKWYGIGQQLWDDEVNWTYVLQPKLSPTFLPGAVPMERKKIWTKTKE